MTDLLALAKRAAETEDATAVSVLEDALEAAGWLTTANAARVFDVLFRNWPARPEADIPEPREWFRIGFDAGRVCEVALSEFGREFLASIAKVLGDDRRTDSAKGT